MKSSESTEIVTKYIPKLVNEANIPIVNIKTDCTTSKTALKRADILISEVHNDDKQFERKLIALIEVKQSSAKYLDIYEEDGCVNEKIKELIEKNVLLYEKNSNKIQYGHIAQKEWFNALIQGMWKARKLGLCYFGVSNIDKTVFYHSHTLERLKVRHNIEVVSDGRVKNNIVEEELRGIPTYVLLCDLKKQIVNDNTICDYSNLDREEQNEKISMTEYEFLDFLTRIHNLFYKGSLKGSKENLGEIILTFIFFKHLEERVILQKREKEFEERGIKLWSNWIAECDGKRGKPTLTLGKQIYDIVLSEIRALNNCDDEIEEDGQYSYGYPKEYREFANVLVAIDNIPKTPDGYEFIYKIYMELNGYNTSTSQHNHSLYLHACNFDVYGAIYEKFKDKSQKEELGQYYTKRHISKMLAHLLLKPYVDKIKEEIEFKRRDKKRLGSELEVNDIVDIIVNVYTDIKVIDPSCGTGGLLTECYSYLEQEYVNILQRKEARITEVLSKDIFSGIDIKDDLVKKSKLNMFFAGDGHTQLYQGDSLDLSNSPAIKFYENCDKNKWNVLISNPPYGKGKEYLFIEKYIKALKYGGRVGIIIPNGVLENPTKVDFRKMLITNIKIESIISLNKYVFAPYTKQKTYILIGYKREKNIIDEINNNFIEGGKLNYGRKNASFEKIKDKIWEYILDYDGFNLGDNRWPTNLIAVEEDKPVYIHNDIPEVVDKYLKGTIIKQNQIHIDGSLIGVPKDDSYYLKKADNFIVNEDINNKNYYNLLPEFYMRPYVPEYITQTELEKCRDDIISSIKGMF